ncbi:MAG TPA: hypothetical protein VF680_13070 [Allosphingosinicella sp.]|jgi:uncharacterized repeat protein (TIGR01451 family)
MKHIDCLGYRKKTALLAAASAVAVIALPAPAFAAGTPAGTDIKNTATATYEPTPGGPETSIDSNTVTLKVDELLDVSVAWGDPSDVVASPGATAQVLRFTVSNGGNGSEAFALSTAANGGGDDFDPTVTAVVLDSNGNNAYDAGVDTVYVPGSNDPVLDADGSITVFVLSNIPAGASDTQRGKVDLLAAAKTGTGAPGTSFAGLGQGGGNAVVGATGADAEDDGWYKIAKAAIAFSKSAKVSDPWGGTTQAPGATITYTLTANVSGTGSLGNVRIADPIPAGTTYTPGSLTLDAAALSDAADTDAGAFTGTGIAVGLGALASGASRTVTFQVKID